MSRADKVMIEQLKTRLGDAQAQLGEARARDEGRLRGESVVAEQLAKDIRLGAIREESHRANAATAYGNLQRVLRAVAAHVVDIAEGNDAGRSVQALRDELDAVGAPLRQAILALQVERAESSAAEAAAAVAEPAAAAR